MVDDMQHLTIVRETSLANTCFRSTISTAAALAHAVRSEMDQPYPRQNPQCYGQNSSSALFGGYGWIDNGSDFAVKVVLS